MQTKAVFVNRCGPRLVADQERVLLRQYYPLNDDIARRIVVSVSHYPMAVVEKELARVFAQYTGRHKRCLRTEFKDRFDVVNKKINNGAWAFEPDRELLMGSFFMHEYSIETCALFNGSAVPHWDQTGLPPNTCRFILSLRATGEQHVSSITFRVGTVDSNGRVTIDRPHKQIAEPRSTDGVNFVFPDFCTDLSERVVFPVTPQQKNGIEDARFVLFTEDDGTKTYYGTYTAYDGRNIEPQMISTSDNFKTIKFEPLTGAIENKGMALFPRKVNGKYMMLSRQDDENILIMSSDSLLHWENPKIIVRPEEMWEQFKMGNCGSPIETPKGWVVLTHGVGPLRQYGLGIVLLDLEDPSKVIGRLKDPLIAPTEDEREGYVPNVVYTCGGMLYGDVLLIPYAASDSYSTFATVSLAELYAALGV